MIDLNSFVPFVWLAVAVVGLAIAIMGEIEAVQDFLVTKPTNGFRMLAVGDILQEGIRIVLYLIFAVIGIVAIVATRDREIEYSFSAWLLVWAEFLILAKTVIQLTVRRYLRRTTSIGGPNP